MDEALELLEELECNAIQLRFEGGELRYRAPEGALTPSRKAAIRRLESELIQLVSLRSTATRDGPHVEGAESVWIPTKFQANMAMGSQSHNVYQVRRLESQIDVRDVEEALARVIERHDALRTVYLKDLHGRLWAATKSPSKLNVIHHDISSWPEDRREDEARRFAQEFVDTTFDLEKGPLLRLAYLRVSSSEVIYLLLVHHSIFDAASVTIFFNELKYFALTKGAIAPSPPLQFREYVKARNLWLSGPEAYQQLLAWNRILDGLTRPFWLPKDRTTPSNDAMMFPPISGLVGGDAFVALQQLAREEATTLFVLTLAAFALTLSEWIERDDVLLWNIHLGRTNVRARSAIGLFTDFMLLRIKLAGARTLPLAVKCAREGYVEALRYAGMTPPLLAPIIRRVSPEDSFGVIINFIPIKGSASNNATERLLDCVKVQRQSDGRLAPTEPYPLMLTVAQTDDSISWKLRHKSAFFEDSTIRRLSDRLSEVLSVTEIRHPS